MTSSQKSPLMSQKIFNMGLTVEQVSIYLLCCGLADSDQDISTENLLKIWNGTEQMLTDGLNTLIKNNILLQVISDSKAKTVYRVMDADRWVQP
jgi:hypothetical protein